MSALRSPLTLPPFVTSISPTPATHSSTILLKALAWSVTIMTLPHMIGLKIVQLERKATAV